MSTRLLEIDALRGLSVLAMLGFHAAFDAMLLGFWTFEPYDWPLILFVRCIQFLFLGLVGVSVALSTRGFRAQLRRGLRIFACGLLVSVATWVIFPQEFVRFGVLHCIGLSIPIVLCFKGKKLGALVLAGFSWFLGYFFAQLTVDTAWFIPLGLTSADFVSLDYFPLFPWLAVPLVGLVMGEWVYKDREPTRLSVLNRAPGLSVIGQHALAIYLLHQPVLYFSLWGLSRLL